MKVSTASTTLTAAKLYCLPASTSHRDNLVLMDSVILQSGGGSNFDSWGTGVNITYASNAVFNNCTFAGRTINGPGTGLEIAGNSVNTLISNTNINFFATGINCPVYQEGLIIVDSCFVGVTTGIYTKSNDAGGLRSTYLSIVGSHVDARNAGSVALDLENLSGLFCSSSLFIGSGTNTINLKRVFESAIIGCQIYGAATNGITLTSATVTGSGTLPSKSISITGNTFRGQGTSINATSGSVQIYANSNTKSDSNTSSTFDTITNVDSGTSNFIGDSIGFNTVVTTSGTPSPLQYFNVDISKAALGKKADAITVDVLSNTSMGALYYWDSVSNTKTNAVIGIFNYDGTDLPASVPVRVALGVGPSTTI